MHSLAREAAEQVLTDEVEFVEPKTASTLNRATFKETLDPDVVMWRGKAAISTAASSRTSDTAGGPTQVDEAVLRTAMTAPALQPGSLVIVTAVGDPESGDAELVGEVFEVTRSATRSNSILRRFVLIRYKPHSSLSTA